MDIKKRGGLDVRPILSYYHYARDPSLGLLTASTRESNARMYCLHYHIQDHPLPSTRVTFAAASCGAS